MNVIEEWRPLDAWEKYVSQKFSITRYLSLTDIEKSANNMNNNIFMSRVIANITILNHSDRNFAIF